ncbi:MAG: hypothetical protein JJE52_16005 [Acidimicrobiia bacterium]|nr:hypothetical protein [Acidimicrobiia bacterium]
MTRRGERPERVPDRHRPVGRDATPARPPLAPSDPDRPATAGGSEEIPGRGLVVASWIGTAALLVAAAAGLVALDSMAPVVVALSILMFTLGTIAFFIAYAAAVSRSRHELIGIGGLYFMAGTAPAAVRRSMMGSLAVQVLVVVVVVVIEPFSSLVFTSLAPLYGLGLAGWWTARHGSFTPKPADIS